MSIDLGIKGYQERLSEWFLFFPNENAEHYMTHRWRPFFCTF